MRAAIFSFSARGAELSKKVAEYLHSIGYETELQTVAKYAEQTGIAPMLPDHNGACAAVFNKCQALVYVGAVGIAVRTIAPFIKSKLTDLSRCLAAALGATACVTTATDVNGLFAVDEWAARNRMVLCSLAAAKDFAAALVGDERVGLYYDKEFQLTGPLPKLVAEDSSLPVGMAVTLQKHLQPFATTVRLLPKIVHLGIGCRRNTPLENIEALVLPELEKLQLDKRSVVAIASVDLKKDEQGLLAFAKKYNFAANFYSADELNSVAGDFTPSAFVQSVVGVSNVCERSAVKDSKGGRLLLRKTSLNGVTLAVAAENLVLDFARTGLKTD